MSVSTLTLALSTFNELDVRAISLGKDNSNFYHVYYVKDGVNRVMLVPRKSDKVEVLQYEVGVLLSRSVDAQNAVGKHDAHFN